MGNEMTNVVIEVKRELTTLVVDRGGQRLRLEKILPFFFFSGPLPPITGRSVFPRS
jgi:hypothetical protein